MKLQYIGTSALYDVTIKAIKSNVIEALGANLVAKEVGFMLIDDLGNEFDYSAYSTLYRTVSGGFQFSNDGEVWIEPTKTVTVQAVWNDEEDSRGIRPSSVKVTVFDNETSIGNVTLNAKNNWSKSYENVPQSHTYTITAPEETGYDREVSGTTVTYSIQAAYEPTVEEQLEELNMAVVDLDERVYTLEEGN